MHRGNRYYEALRAKYIAEAKNVLDVNGKLTVQSSDVFKVSGTLDKTANQVYNITKSDKII